MASEEKRKVLTKPNPLRRVFKWVNIMKVAIEVNGEVIWYRDSDKQEGMASLGYLKDGTQQKIIAALEDALTQANGENLCWDDVN